MTFEPQNVETLRAGLPGLQSLQIDGSTTLGRLGGLQVRLARAPSEVEAAQELRHRVFQFETGKSDCTGRDFDHLDAWCDHLIVTDEASGMIVGTYRLLREERAAQAGGFYSQGEYDLNALLSRKPGRRVLELGRSCVLAQFRTKRTAELLWQGIWAYCRRWNIDLMCGCASFSGTVPALHALPLSFLHHHAQASGDWTVRAHVDRHVEMDMMPVEAVDLRTALNAMPPLIKGYLRLGAMFGNGAVVDHEFGTTDVLVILPVERISSRYIAHYGAGADRFV